MALASIDLLWSGASTGSPASRRRRWCGVEARGDRFVFFGRRRDAPATSHDATSSMHSVLIPRGNAAGLFAARGKLRMIRIE